jgi:HAD superfamily phosphoserine phosphatase-like hydrolase
MSKPRAFISSTYVDLLDLRDVIAAYLDDRSFDAVMFERGGVYYDPSLSVDKACIEEVDKADLCVLVIGGRYGSPAGDARPGKAYNSVTREEYEHARRKGVPTFVFVRAEVDAEFQTYLRNDPKVRVRLKFAHVDNINIFKLLDQIHQLSRGNAVIPFSTAVDLVEKLDQQLAGMLLETLRAKRFHETGEGSCYVNPYKLFFFRVQKGLSFSSLQAATGIKRRRLMDLEARPRNRRGALSVKTFQRCSLEELQRLESSLKCHGLLRGGRDDDFLSKYIHYYETYKGRPAGEVRTSEFALDLYPARAVVFDFDGTLTKRVDDLTTWERIWVALGYTVDNCALYLRQFSAKTISHQEWCAVTLDHFRRRRLTREHLDRIAQEVTLLSDTDSVLRELHARGTQLYVLSGSIRQVIRVVLGSLYELFTDVAANDLVFGSDGVLSAINGTEFDFEGKADFIRRISARTGISPLEILFVGNSCNDVYASLSGARTLCINPHFTNPNVLDHWTYCMRRVTSMKDVLAFIDRTSPARADEAGAE